MRRCRTAEMPRGSLTAASGDQFLLTRNLLDPIVVDTLTLHKHYQFVGVSMRPATTTVVRFTISCTLLAVILLQVCPFALQQPTRFGRDPQDGTILSFKALPVCDDHENSSGFPSDDLFAPAPAGKVSFVPEEKVLPLSIAMHFSGGFAPAVFRPPRSHALHLPSPGAGSGLC
jgi:hypothetical protein